MQPQTVTPSTGTSNFSPADQAKFDAILAAHNYTPPSQAGNAPARNWRSLIQQPSSTPSYLSKVGTNLGETFKQGAENVTKDITNIPAQAQAAHGAPGDELANYETAGVAAAGHLAGDVAGTAGGIIGSAIEPLLPDSVKAKLGDITKQITDRVNAIPGMTPEIAKSLGDVFNTASLLGGAKAEEPVTQGVKDVGTSAKEAMLGTPEEQAASKAASQASELAQQKATAAESAVKAHTAIDNEVRNTAEKYPTVGTALNKAEVDRGTEPTKVMSSYAGGKALPVMTKTGKMNSIPAINFLKTQISELGQLKENLVKTAKDNVSIEDFKQAALDRIDRSSASLAKKQAQKADVSKIIDGLNETYPDGIPTTELDKIKTEQASESKSYNSKSTFSPDSHAIVGQTAADAVITKGGEAPIDELNKWMASHYDAIKVLKAMNGKTPHGGMFSRHVGGIAGEVAGLAGGIAVGHPFIGAMVGRGFSEAVNTILSNHFISNPLKASLIKAMPDASPEIIQKALDYLKTTEGNPAELSTPPIPASLPAAPKTT